jgi:hypothetical protein
MLETVKNYLKVNAIIVANMVTGFRIVWRKKGRNPLSLKRMGTNKINTVYFAKRKVIRINSAGKKET